MSPRPSAPYSTFVHEPATQYVQQPMQTVQYIEQPVKYEYVQQPVQYVQPVQSEPRVQAPVFFSQDCELTPSGVYQWNNSDSSSVWVNVVHSQLDMGSRTCPVMLFVTTNGSNPSEQNFLHYGRAPLSFRIDKSCRIKAIAINKEMGSSVMVQQDFNIYTPCGVGLLLKKVGGLHGISVDEVVYGGSAWNEGQIQVGDKIRMIDDTVIEKMDLDDIIHRIVGPAGSKVTIQVLRREHEDETFTVTLP